MTESALPSRCIAHRLDWTGSHSSSALRLDAGEIDASAAGVRHTCLVVSPASVSGEPARDEFVRRVSDLRSSSIITIAIEASLSAPVGPPDRMWSAMDQAAGEIIALLDAADAADIRLVILRPVRRGDDAHRAGRLEETLNHFIEALLATRFEAEARAVRMAFDVSTADFLGTPAAARAMIDECNSCWVGAHVVFEQPKVEVEQAIDWIEALGRRVYAATVNDASATVTPDRAPSALGAPSNVASPESDNLLLARLPGSCPIIVAGSGD